MVDDPIVILINTIHHFVHNQIAALSLENLFQECFQLLFIDDTVVIGVNDLEGQLAFTCTVSENLVPAIVTEKSRDEQ